MITFDLDPNEKVYRLSEMNLVRPPTYQWRRYQIILVNRGDRIAEWWYDLGPSFAFTVEQFTFPMLWEHTVAEAQEIAEIKRHDDFWQRFLAEKKSESTLLLDAVEQRDEHRKVIANRSVFGPGGHKQRNGFSRRGIAGVISDRRRN